MYELNKKQLEYLSRIVMPELYERQTAKDAYWDSLKDRLTYVPTNEDITPTYKTSDKKMNIA